MKIGMRKPSIKRSIKARTTGKIKRKMKRAVNPFYGKKGVGFIKNPKKAIYNKVYRKTTFSPFSLGKGISGVLLGLMILPFWLIFWAFKLMIQGLILLIAALWKLIIKTINSRQTNMGSLQTEETLDEGTEGAEELL